MNDHPENENESNDPSQEPLHAEFQHRAITARVQETAAHGVFANAAIILSGRFEFVIDFILRMGKPDRVMVRVVMPIPVLGQFVKTLRESMQNYEQQFGKMPELPSKSESQQAFESSSAASPETSSSTPGGFVGAIGPEGSVTESSESTPRKSPPPIDDIYDELKLEDELLGGAYANAVLIRHSPSEFCFDFVTNIYPKSSVNARVFMSVPQVKPLLNSMSHSYEQFQRRHNPPAEGDS